MLIAQISDVHLGFGQTEGPAGDPVSNLGRLDRVLNALANLRKQPDLLLITGDLVDGGSNWAYAPLRERLARVSIPIKFALGNHDNRDAFIGEFGDAGFDGGKLRYAFTQNGIRIVILDTLKPGYHEGEFSAQDANWLEQTLAAQSDAPTVIAMHHPPIETGIDWMSPKLTDDWVVRLNDVLSRHSQVRLLIAGHIHCHISGRFIDRPVSVSRSVAPGVALELDPLDIDVPDGRAMIIDDHPGYSLHFWNGSQFTSYSRTASEAEVLVRYDADHASIPRTTMDIDKP